MASSPYLTLPSPHPRELVLILDFEDASLAFFQEMSMMSVIDAYRTPFEYAVSMVPHWTWVDLALRIVHDILVLDSGYFQHDGPSNQRVMTYEMLVELTNHPDIKAAMYEYSSSPHGALFYRPTPTYDMEVVKQALDEIIMSDLEEVLLESLMADGIDTHAPGFRLYTTTDLDSQSARTDVAIWRFLMVVFTQVTRAAVGIGREYGLGEHALARYDDFEPAKPIHGGQSEYLYAVTIREG